MSRAAARAGLIVEAEPVTEAITGRAVERPIAVALQVQDDGRADPSRSAPSSGRRRRTRKLVQRECRLTPRFSLDELEVVRVAAAVAGLTPTGWVAKTAVDVATARVSPPPPALLEALPELLAARSQVRRFGVLVNQAMAKWHSVVSARTIGSPVPWPVPGGDVREQGGEQSELALGAPPPELLHAVALVSRVLLRLEEAAVALAETRRRTMAEPSGSSDQAVPAEAAGGGRA